MPRVAAQRREPPQGIQGILWIVRESVKSHKLFLFRGPGFCPTCVVFLSIITVLTSLGAGESGSAGPSACSSLYDVAQELFENIITSGPEDSLVDRGSQCLRRVSGCCQRLSNGKYRLLGAAVKGRAIPVEKAAQGRATGNNFKIDEWMNLAC